jgi:hypothetical protein
MKKDYTRKAGHLEDSFFLNQDQVLINNMKKLEQRKRTKAELSEISGIHNDHLLEKFLELEISPKDLAAVSIVPLVVVAWADGSVDNKEREAALVAAEKMGFAKGCECYEILNDWLTHQPRNELLESWMHYVAALVADMGAEDTATFKKEVLEHASMVAKASGGLAGFAKVSAREKAVLAKLESAFQKA